MNDVTENCVLSSRIRLARNIKKLPFPFLMTEKQALYDVILPMEKILKGKNMQIYLLKDINELNREMLIEKHLVSCDLVRNYNIAGLCLNDDLNISIMLNEEDHFRQQCILHGFNLDGAFEKINEIDALIMENMEIAYDEKLGFLTACPTNLGTAMRSSVMLFLPGLSISGRINKIVDLVQRLGLVVRGAFGESSQAIGYFYQISNQNSFGADEQQIISNLSENVMKICNFEKQARQDLFNRNNDALKDEIMFALNRLCYSEEISHSEFLNLFAKAKFGIDFDFFKINDKIAFDSLLEDCASAHIQVLNGRKLSKEEIDIERAKLLKNSFLKLLN